MRKASVSASANAAGLAAERLEIVAGFLLEHWSRERDEMIAHVLSLASAVIEGHTRTLDELEMGDRYFRLGGDSWL
jgi:hypothetical protein